MIPLRRPDANPPPPTSSPGPLHPVWSHALIAPARGLALARERGWLLAWDEAHWLYVLDHKGQRQAQVRAGGSIVTACCSDDGSAWVAVGDRGEVWWLAPDLSTRWEGSLPGPALAAALEPFGQYLAVADTRGNVCVFTRLGRPVFRVQSHRPLHHLAFAPQAPALVGAADFGLVAAFDLTGRWLWRDGLVVHVGALTVSGDGRQVLLACFSEGILCYGKGGKKQGRLAVPEPCRLVSGSFDGLALLVAGMGNRVMLLDSAGNVVSDHALERPAAGLALGALADTAALALSGGPILKLGRNRNEKG
jgi:hypothetical protein